MEILLITLGKIVLLVNLNSVRNCVKLCDAAAAVVVVALHLNGLIAVNVVQTLL